MLDYENNAFYRARAEIARISENENYDADTACVIYAARAGLHAYESDLKDFRRALRAAQLNKGGTLYDLFYSAAADIRREKNNHA